jgi:DMSO/TMAO reductase YedYZ molybdopterin-dependent catalytic subunit
MTVTNDYPGGYWEDQGYDWFSGSEERPGKSNVIDSLIGLAMEDMGRLMD